MILLSKNHFWYLCFLIFLSLDSPCKLLYSSPEYNLAIVLDFFNTCVYHRLNHSCPLSIDFIFNACQLSFISTQIPLKSSHFLIHLANLIIYPFHASVPIPLQNNQLAVNCAKKIKTDSALHFQYSNFHIGSNVFELYKQTRFLRWLLTHTL